MIVDVVMPKMGESLQEGTIIRWLKKPGDKVERDEMILEISTDKVDTEVPSPTSGVLQEVLAAENETIEVGKVIARIETEASANNAVPAPPPIAEEAPKSTGGSAGVLTDVVMPKMGESLQEGTIIRWLKKPGDKVERDEMILEISTDKVDTEVPSPTSGILAEILAAENETVEVGKVIARISSADQPAATATIHESAPSANFTIKSEAQTNKASTENKFYSPVVRSIAEQEGIPLGELDSIEGSGIDGRVTKQDILKYIETRKKPTSIVAPQPKAVQVVAPSPIVKPERAIVQNDDEIIPMDRVRQIIAEHMIFSKHTSAHVTSVGEADVTKLVKWRNAHKDEFEKKNGFKLTYTPFFAKAVIDAVKQFPMVNVSVEGKNIIKHIRINLSFATALDDGNLIVPVIKNSDSLNLSGLARSIFDLSTRARAKKLNPDDIQGGTITLTNVGTFGTLFGTPVINQPQTAIIGVGAIQKRPVVRKLGDEDVIAIRDMLYCSITYDHRVIDGMLAGMYLNAFVKALESMDENSIQF